MSDPKKTSIDSDAFRRAELKSERVRTRGLLLALGVLLAFLLLRTLVLGVRGEHWNLGGSALLLLAFIAFEAAMLRRLHQRGEIRGWSWHLGPLIETLLPTLGIVLLTANGDLGPYRALASPAVGAYFLLIVLSTLRLSPLQSHRIGLACALGHGSVVVFTYLFYPEHPARSAIPLALFLTYGVLLWLTGLVAAGVAREIRGHVAAALEEARESERVHHDLEMARTIQQGLLPKQAPVLPGYEIAGWNQPADQTGGDYYHWQTLSDGRVAFSLADVTGHGIGPALVTAACRAYARASLDGQPDLGAVMSHVNRLLAEDLPLGKLVQLVVAVVEPGSSSIEMLSAGHGPLLVVRAEGVQRLNAHGVPLGVSAALVYGPAQRIELAPGDLLVLLTDGFFEWENKEGEEYGLDRLDRVLFEQRERPPAEIISSLYEAVLDFSGGTTQDDDLTAVVIQRGPA
jgi:serine phosphatase RsbU (regulator of sigma subunit)